MIEISIEDLKINNSYYIQSKSYPNSRQIGNFKKSNSLFCLAEFDKIGEIIKNDGSQGNSGLSGIPPLDKSYRHSKCFRFYEVRKYKILLNYEKKLINYCLKKIIGDENFDWY